MRIWSVLLVIGIISCCFYSCERDFDIVQNGSKKLVVNCLLDNEREIRVFLTEGGILDGSKTKLNIDDAQVSIYRNDSFLTSLNYTPYDSLNSLGVYCNHVFPTVGSNYSIQINHPRFGYVAAEDYLAKIPIVSDYHLYEFKNPIKHQKSSFKLLINDDAERENYYLLAPMCMGIERMRKDSTTFINHSFERPAAPNLLSYLPDTVRESGFYLLFSDKNFNGQTKEIDFWFYDNVDTSLAVSDTVLVELQAISYAHYQYIKSLEAYRNTSKSTYPDAVFSNIKNGLGVFMTAGIERLKVPVK